MDECQRKAVNYPKRVYISDWSDGGAGAGAEGSVGLEVRLIFDSF